MTLTFLRETLARYHAVCDSRGVNPDDVDLQHFSEEARLRFYALANEDIRREINRDTHPLEKV